MNTRRCALSDIAAAVRKALAATAAMAAAAATGGALAAPDLSKWTCSLCPDESAPGITGSVTAGVIATSDDSHSYGNYTGLARQGVHLLAGGGLLFRGSDDLYGSAAAEDLGLATRRLAAELGREGGFRLRLGYAEIPRHVADGALSPFTGIGGAELGLPAGYPAATTQAMPLASTLQPVEVQTRRKRLEAGLTWSYGRDWGLRLAARHEVKDGIERLAGSFFSTTTQLLAPVDQTIDAIEAAASYTSGRLHLSAGASGSWFRNGNDSLIWTNPFLSGSATATRGEMALAPDNQFTQVYAAAAYELAPSMRLSGDIAYGRMTQDAALRAATLNTGLGAAQVALPVSSIDARVDVFNANARFSAQPLAGVQLVAAYSRDARDNKTDSRAWPAVSTDLFVGTTPRVNQPFSFTRDLVRLSAEGRLPGSLKVAVGLDGDWRERTLQEVTTTRETTLWLRALARPLDGLALTLKLLHGNRDPDAYGSAAWINPPENPLLRKFNLASRTREAAQARADATLGEGIGLAVHVDTMHDAYDGSAIGLTNARSTAYGADLSWALDDDTTLQLFGQVERIRSSQLGSQSAGAADWSARARDVAHALGAGLRHKALKGKLELGADLTFTRSWADVAVDTGALEPGFPTARSRFDGVRLSAAWKLQDQITLLGSYAYEVLRSTDWHTDGVTPSTVPVLLSLGEASPHYRMNVLRLAVRYAF
ncbi:MAG: MtrB/PioB family decaheme-associated outer membrane protein [Rubrivivax sp.]|nr:MtrB/PioB family decaheme-associated outer membrane protein [Rubrivivax sp.]